MTAAAEQSDGAGALTRLTEASRVRLGASAETAPEVLRAPAADRSLMVRAAVATNMAAPVQAHRLLAADEDERVRAAIAEVVREMPEAPRELILRLAHDSAVGVCEPVIRLSPLLGTEDLLALLADAPAPAPPPRPRPRRRRWRR